MEYTSGREVVTMQNKRFTKRDCYFPEEARIEGVRAEVCYKLGISDATFYIWHKKYGVISPPEMNHLRQFVDEKPRLRKLLAELSLDNVMLQNALAKMK
ncbi:TPA: hypothetical protein N5O02_003935 [Enterobacter asburiae]|nr:hypothetical protein [Enterobacter asburiae]